ncbi:MAG: hypothetical protein WHV61_09300 [Burkholderiales bacterium]
MPRKPDIAAILEEFAQGLPRLPGGRVDYSSARRVPVLVCFVGRNRRPKQTALAVYPS